MMTSFLSYLSSHSGVHRVDLFLYAHTWIAVWLSIYKYISMGCQKIIWFSSFKRRRNWGLEKCCSMSKVTQSLGLNPVLVTPWPLLFGPSRLPSGFVPVWFPRALCVHMWMERRMNPVHLGKGRCEDGKIRSVMEKVNGHACTIQYESWWSCVAFQTLLSTS